MFSRAIERGQSTPRNKGGTQRLETLREMWRCSLKNTRKGGQEDTAVSKPYRNFSSILVLNSCGASTFTSGVQDRIQRINSFRP